MSPCNSEEVIVRQTMYILRHGVAYHNIPFRTVSKEGKVHKIHPPNKRDPRYTDSKLVLPKAHLQARKAGQRLKKALATNNDHREVVKAKLDGVIVSPLSRCLETAYFVVDELLNSGNEINQGNPTDLFQQSALPWICKEDLREAFGIHYSDKRSCKSTLQENWPFVQFEADMTESDEKWKPDRRETFQDVYNRIDSFLLWLSWVGLQKLYSQKDSNSDNNVDNEPLSKNSDHFLVVSHGVWIECLFRKYFPQILDGGKRVHNCDLYRAEVVCTWKQQIKEGGGQWQCQSISLENVSFLNS